jgi:hypothetical protein
VGDDIIAYALEEVIKRRSARLKPASVIADWFF